MTIVLRLLHIILGVLWVGGIGLVVMFILPAARKAGPAGGQFMQVLVNQTKFTAYLPLLGFVTVLSGLGLFWHDSSISAGGFMASRAGMTYSIGGAAAIVALIVGGIMGAGSANQLATISAAVAASGGPPTPAQTQQIAALQARMQLGARIAFALTFVTLVAMATARYL